MMNLEKCCYPNCHNCGYEDCINDNLTEKEKNEQDQHDREIIGGRKYGRNLVVWNYQHSEKGKEAIKRYNTSEKGKERNKRYLQTEKGKETMKRKRERKIESGKNAEYCRRYYQKKKAERLISIN